MTVGGQWSASFRKESCYPEDCGEESDFLRHVYEAALEVPVIRVDGTASTARVLLTLLTYSYARGLYSAEEIASSAATNPMIRYICVNDVPGPAQIRRFRRHQKAAVVQALCILLEKAFPHARSKSAALQEAMRRLDRAIQQDSMDLDV